MKNNQVNSFIGEIVGAEWFTALHYKIVLYPIDNQATQAELSRELKAKPPNVNKVCKELIACKIIKVVEVSGRNKVLATNTSWCNTQIKGQLTIQDI